MPHIDGRSGELVLRIVYDGAPEAGKTTNVRALGTLISLARRGATGSPGTTGERTEFFDWLDFSGGYVDGRKVRCQIVSVPGQPALLHRRRYLLESADTIVFVADSRESELDAAAEGLATTLRIAARSAGAVPIGLVVQANKQDLAGACDPERVGPRLGVPASTQVVPSVAAAGEGLMQTFTLAVRLATERARALLMSEALRDALAISDTPDALHSLLVALDLAEEQARTLREAAEKRPSAPPEAQRTESVASPAEQAVITADARTEERPLLELEPVPATALAHAEASVYEEAPQPVPSHGDETSASTDSAANPPETATLRAEALSHCDVVDPPPHGDAAHAQPHGDAADAQPHGDTRGVRSDSSPEDPADASAVDPAPVAPRAPQFFDPTDVASGHVWPPVKGRAAILAATAEVPRPSEGVAAWAPEGAIERSTESWLLHTTPHWEYESEPVARHALVGLVRRILPSIEVLPEGRAFAIGRDGERWRLWMLTHRAPSFLDAARVALERGTGIQELVASATLRLRAFGLLGRPLRGGARAFALSTDGVALFSLDDGLGPAPDGREPLTDLADEIASRHVAAADWIRARARGLST